MTEWRNWSGNVVTRPETIVRPRDEAELATIIRTASQVRVTGAGHSFMPLCETTGTLVSLDDMAGDMVVASDRQSVDAPAGWSLKRLTGALWAQGLSLPNQGDVNSQTLGGALATGTHGTGKDLPSLSALVQSSRLVIADGSIVDCDATTEPRLFEAQRLSLGLLGIATRVRIAVVPALHLEERVEQRPLDEVLERLPELAAATRHMEFFLFPYASSVTLKTLDPTEAVKLTAQEGDDRVFQACCDLAAAASRSVPMLQRSLARVTRPSRRAGPAWQIFPSERTVRFEEMEYEMPVANAIAALREALALVRSRRMPLIFPFEFRMVAADNIWLSPFHAGPCASISVHQYASMEWSAHFTALEAVFRGHGGRPHWAKRHTLTSADVSALYPMAQAFGRERKRADPEGKFLNDHLRRLFDFSL